MKFKQLLVVLLVGLAVCAGCKKADTAATTASVSNTAAAVVSANLSEPRQAQPRLQTMKLWLGAEELITELALTGEQQMTGMMFRTNMAENEAMLFVFPTPHQTSFWMKNTRLPLSAAYIDPDGVILEIHDFQPFNTNAVVAASDHVQFVLETPQGWFQRHNVNTGAVVRTERGSLQDTFFRRQ